MKFSRKVNQVILPIRRVITVANTKRTKDFSERTKLKMKSEKKDKYIRKSNHRPVSNIYQLKKWLQHVGASSLRSKNTCSKTLKFFDRVFINLLALNYWAFFYQVYGMRLWGNPWIIILFSFQRWGILKRWQKCDVTNTWRVNY